MENKTLKDCARDKGLKLADIAAHMGVNKATVTRWSQGRVPAERVSELSGCTGIPPHILRPDIFEAPQPKGN